MNLYADFLNHDGEIIQKSVHHLAAYQIHFSSFVLKPILLFEIGTGCGGSSQLWKRFFGPLAKIVTVDINPAARSAEDEQISVRIGNQSDKSFLYSLLDEFGRPDIVIDDGSHIVHDVVTSFDCLYREMASSGLYAIEATQTSYWPEYGGGFRKPGTIIEICKILIDELHTDHTNGIMPPTNFSHHTIGMHIYDGLIFFERGNIPSKANITVKRP